MSTEYKNVIIVGAGGNLGPSILTAFLEKSSFNTTVLSRESSSSTFPSGVKVVRANYDSHESLTSALKGQDVVISLVGGMALGDQNKLIDASISAGVKRFVPSEFGSNTVDPKITAIVPIFGAKTGTVDYLKSKEKEISWTSVISGPFLDWGLKTGFIGFNFSSKTATLLDDGVGKFSASNLHQIGLAVIKALERPAETKNTYIYISSLTTSQAEILPVVEKVTGEKWTVKNVASKDLIASGGEKLGKGDFSGIVELIQGAAFGGAGLGDHRSLLWDEKLGLQQESLEETVKAVVAGLGQK